MRDLLIGGDSAPRISDVEPFVMQLPSTLPLETSNDLNSLMEQLSLTKKAGEPVPFGKILVMKSGKVVLRVPSNN